MPISVKRFYESSRNNLSSSLKVFEIAKKISVPVVYASSSAIYGNLPVGDDIKNRFDISSPYAQDKLSLEITLKCFLKITIFLQLVLGFLTFMGQIQNANSPYSAVIPIFINRMKKNMPVTVNVIKLGISFISMTF